MSAIGREEQTVRDEVKLALKQARLASNEELARSAGLNDEVIRRCFSARETDMHQLSRLRAWIAAGQMDAALVAKAFVEALCPGMFELQPKLSVPSRASTPDLMKQIAEQQAAEQERTGRILTHGSDGTITPSEAAEIDAADRKARREQAETAALTASLTFSQSMVAR